MKRPERITEIFSMSALDLFASAMGAFMILAVIMIPYYLNEFDVDSIVREATQALEESRRARAAVEDAAEQTEAAADAAEDAAQAAEADAEAARRGREDAQQSARNAQGGAEDCDRELSSVQVKDLDLAIVLDTTGSMGEEIAALRDELAGIVRILSRITVNLRIGIVAYRDDADAAKTYLTSVHPLTSMDPAGLSSVLDFLAGLDATGGDDWPEAVGRGLDAAMVLDWSPDSRRRIAVVGDATEHPDRYSETLATAARFASASTSSQVSAVYTPPAKPPAGLDAEIDRLFFEALAKAGGGIFVGGGGTMTEAILLTAIGQGA